MNATRASLGQRSITRRGGKPVRGRRGRPSPERSSQITDSIVKAAGSIFFEEGYEGTSMEAVARAVGIPKTTLYKRFADKNELLRAVIDDKMTGWAASAEGQAPPQSSGLEQTLVDHVTTMLSWTTRPEVRSVHRLVSNLPDAHVSGFVGKSFWGYQNMVKRLVRTIEDLGPGEGVVTNDPEGMADILMAMVGGWVVNRNSPERFAPEEARALAERFIAVALRGKDAW